MRNTSHYLSFNHIVTKFTTHYNYNLWLGYNFQQTHNKRQAKKECCCEKCRSC